MFDHTVKRELYITGKLSKILLEKGFLCGNSSVGFWEYDDFDELMTNFGKNLKIQLQNSFSEIDKYCGVFRTIGDKRLGVHLL